MPAVWRGVGRTQHQQASTRLRWRSGIMDREVTVWASSSHSGGLKFELMPQ